MTQTKKKTLIVLATTLILLLATLVSLVGQSRSGSVASADSTAQTNATVQGLGSVKSNGKAPTPLTKSGTAISTEPQLREFLENGSGTGYLTNNIDNFFWEDNRFTGLLASPDMRVLDGNGYTITLTAYKVAVQKGNPETKYQAESRIDSAGDKPICGGDTTGTKWTMFMSTFLAGEGAQYPNWHDVHGGLVGLLRENQTIRNCNFVFAGNINDSSYATPNSVSMGLVVGMCLGTIDNCSLTVNGSVTFYSGTTCQSKTLGSDALETRAAHTIAFGGFAGMMTHGNAIVSNSKLTLNGNFMISIAGTNQGSAAYDDPYSRCFVGGVVGWCANSAKVYNMVTEGNGTLDARCKDDSKGRTRGLSGIIAAITGGDNADGIASLGGKIGSCGIINGVINRWTGFAKFLTYDTDYSPTGSNENSIQGLIVAVIGRRDTSDNGTTVKDVYMSDDSTNRNYYTGTRYSIACDYTKYPNNRETPGNFGRRYSTNVLIQDVMGRYDGSEDYKKADAANGYLAFSGTAEGAPLWAVYNIGSNEGILWSKSVETTGGAAKTLEYYYDKVKSIGDAKQYDVTHTEISRGNDYNQNQNYVINYTHGKAVYFKKVGAQPIEGTNKSRMPSVEYGEGLSVPNLELYSDYSEDGQFKNYITTLPDSSYWVSISSSNNDPVKITDRIVAPDTYESFIYLENEPGKDYSYIQFINETFRYVSYIYDDPDYIAYKKAHEGYEPVRVGVDGKTLEKQIDWQARVVQEVSPKAVSINWGNPSDVTSIPNSEKYDDITGNTTSYGEYYTTYDGDPVVFRLTVPTNALIGQDSCTAEYEYRLYDSFNDEYKLVDSCVNAGVYKVVVTGLTNNCYTLAGLGAVEYYCIDFEIKAREIGLIMDKLNPTIDGDTCNIQLVYEAREIKLADEIRIFETQAQANSSQAKMAMYNVLAKDKDMLQYEYLAVGEGELNMRNVGTFKMIMSMMGGVNSINYILPDVTNFIVEIVPADATLNSAKSKYEYPYGLLVQDQVNPNVTAIGVGEDGLLTFGAPTYYKKNVETGTFEETDQEPFDAGDYQIKYELLTSVYTNYSSDIAKSTITVDVSIKQREVKFSFVEANTRLAVDYGKIINGVDDDDYNAKLAVVFDRQGAEDGIYAYEYSSSYATYQFILRENGRDTNIRLDRAVDVGEYTVEVGLDFRIGTTSTGWQIDENTKNNYVVVPHSTQIFTVVINKREVNVEINKVEREYGDEVPALIGNANTVAGRAWKYVANEEGEIFEFNKEDNVVLTPVLGTEDQFASKGNYTIHIPDDKDHRTGGVYVYDAENTRWRLASEDDSDTNLPTHNKIDNYTVNVVYTDGNETNNELYVINPRKIKIKVFLNTGSVIYGDALPELSEWKYVGAKEFFEKDGIELELDKGDIVVGSEVGDYEMGMKIVKKDDGSDENYVLEVEYAQFTIVPRTLTIVGAHLVDENGEETSDEIEILYDGQVHKPRLVAEFREGEELVNDDKIDFDYNYFEIVDGVMSTEATEKPSYAGTYRAFISDASDKNYTVVFGEEYERIEIIMTIKKREIEINVLPAYRIYSIEDSLTPIVRPTEEGGGIHPNYEEEGYHYYTQDEAIAIDRDRYIKPFDYVGDSAENIDKQFVQSGDYLQAKMYTDEYDKNLGVKTGVVKIVFNGLEKDLNFLDEEGNWITEEAVGEDGNTIRIIMPRYRNYDITITPGDLHVIGANLSNIGQFVNLRSSEEVYNGEDRYEDFRVITSNQTIFDALKFRVFRYVDSTNRSVLTEAEANNLAKSYGKYTRELVDGKYVYTRNDAEGKYVRKYISRIENGDKYDEKLVDAGQYFKHIEPKDTDIFQGEAILEFYITKAERVVSADDIKASVNYNRISLSSSIPGIEVSFDGAAYVKSNTFSGLSANTTYVVKVRFAETTNYKQSNEIVLNLHTGIDIKSIQSTLAKYDKIDFSNIGEYESKVLAYIGSVSQADYAEIDQAKYAKLQASYEQLFRGANSVIEGAQQVGATAVGKSGKSSTSARTMALSMSGVGVIAMGFTFFMAKRRKDEKEQSVKKAKSFNSRRASKAAVIVVAIMLVCLIVFAGCDPAEDAAFSKADLYKIASYQDDAQTGNRNLTIEVKSSGVSLYKYENGKETVYKGLDVSSFKPGADGIGFEFDDLYFTNGEFEIADGVATFNADIKETLAFLGVRNVTNGKVSVTVDEKNRRLNTIDVSYDVINSGITYNVTVAVEVNY